MATQRQRKNKIEGLWGSDDQWYEEKGKIEDIILGYFADIYSIEHSSDHVVNVVGMKNCITHGMNDVLLKPFRAEEVRIALNQLHRTKAPGPDDMSPIFYQKYWDVVSHNVTKCVLDILNSGLMPCSLNETYICLIPKMDSPQKISKFRLISLCNVIYKIVAKVLANKLK